MKTHPISIYLAGPIDGVDKREACQWREDAAALAPTGVLLVSPAHAYIGTTNPATAREMDRISRSLILSCYGLVANLSGPGRGFGTIREIEFAKMNQRFVSVVVNEEDPIFDSLMSYDLMLMPTVDEAIQSVASQIVDQRERNKNTMMIGPFQFPNFGGGDDDEP